MIERNAFAARILGWACASACAGAVALPARVGP